VISKVYFQKSWLFQGVNYINCVTTITSGVIPVGDLSVNFCVSVKKKNPTRLANTGDGNGRRGGEVRGQWMRTNHNKNHRRKWTQANLTGRNNIHKLFRGDQMIHPYIQPTVNETVFQLNCFKNCFCSRKCWIDYFSLLKSWRYPCWIKGFSGYKSGFPLPKSWR
jgi:hypothetical protein